MTKDEIRKILKENKTVAVVGMSSNPERPSQQVPLYLRAHGYNVIPVNPKATEIAGMKAYPDLLSIPEKVDVVEIFMRAEEVPLVVDQAIKIGAKVVWMQEGIVNEAAAAAAQAAGLTAVQDMCMRATHRFLIGE
ncbi:MAG: CoA-binding protein [Anaerolineae bacterium]